MKKRQGNLKYTITETASSPNKIILVLKITLPVNSIYFNVINEGNEDEVYYLSGNDYEEYNKKIIIENKLDAECFFNLLKDTIFPDMASELAKRGNLLNDVRNMLMYLLNNKYITDEDEFLQRL